MKFVISTLVLGVLGLLFACKAKPPIDFIDEYLVCWDRFAQGENGQVPYLRDNKTKFEGLLASLLVTDEKIATSRVVFYTVVQVGGFIDAKSSLGKEVTRVFGTLPLTEGKKGEREIFAGDLYFWWIERKNSYPAFGLYDEWEKRPFSQNVAIRLYKNAREAHKKKANQTSEPTAPSGRGSP